MDYYLRDIPEEMWRKAKRRSQEHGISLRKLILQGLREQVDQLEPIQGPQVNLNNIKHVFRDWEDLHMWSRTHETSPPLTYALAIYSVDLLDMEQQWQNAGDPNRVIMVAEEIMDQFDGYTKDSELCWSAQGVVNN